MSEVMNVPEGWEVKNFSELAKVNMGQSPDSAYVNENQEGMAFLQGNADFGEKNPRECYWVTEPKKVSKQGDILISVRAPVGDMNIADKEYCIGRGLASLTVNKIDPSYGFYVLFKEKRQLDRLSQGSTFLAVGKNDFDVIKIKYPIDTKEQQKIAKILSTLDQAIEATQKLIAKERNIKKGLMHDLLTNGIDQNGKIRSPQTHKYKESELGLIPEGWEVSCLGNISRTFAGGTPNRDEESYYGGDIPWVKSGEVNQTRINKTEESITNEGLINSSAKLIKNNTILIAMYGATAGQVAILDIDATSNQAVLAVPLMKEDMYYILYSINFHMPKLLFQAQGSGQPNLSKQLVDNLKFLLAPLEEQQKIANILIAQGKKIETEEKNLAKLKELKKGLMDDLLSGKVRVKV